ncbi:hypothetical protein Hanom_Chr00s047591g01778021 [Helianthus anomalus]
MKVELIKKNAVCVCWWGVRRRKGEERGNPSSPNLQELNNWRHLWMKFICM